MIIGIGIDIVELSRIKKISETQSNFVKRILTEAEQIRYNELSIRRKVEYLAGRFAAKEAFVKACGTGISKEWSFTDIEVLNNDRGQPYIKSSLQEKVFISISHSEEYAVAQVIIESNE